MLAQLTVNLIIKTIITNKSDKSYSVLEKCRSPAIK
jgi:hypothetical protein